MGRDLHITDEGTVVLYEAKANGTDTVTLKAPASLAAAYTLTLPSDDGTANQFLQSDGSGNLTWANSTATLQTAYDNGTKIDADGTEVEIEVAAAQGNVALLLDQDDDQHALSITKDGTGAGSGVNVVNAGTGDSLVVQQTSTGRGVFINQDGDAVAISVDSEATGNPLLVLAGLNGNSRGDIALGTVRTGDPSAPSAGDVWYNATSNTLSYYNGTGAISLTANTQNTLDEAYDEGGAGSGRTITADSGAVQITGSAQTLLDIDQSGAFAGVDIACGAAAGLVVAQSNNSALATLTKTGTGAGVVLDVEDDGTGGACLLNQDGNAVALTIDSEATGSQLIEIRALNTNTVGDISFVNTGRTSHPSGPSDLDVWGTLGNFTRLMGYDSVNNRTILSAFGPSYGPANIDTIAAGLLVSSSGVVIAAAETGTTDDVDNISTAVPGRFAQEGDTLIVRADTGDTITLKHNTGNIHLDGSADKALNNGDQIMLIYDGTDWRQLTPVMNLP